jgi:hypothetical protein
MEIAGTIVSRNWSVTRPDVPRLGRRVGLRNRAGPARKKQALIEPADADQHRAKAKEGQRAINAGEVGHVDEENFEHGEPDDHGRRDTQG